MLETAREVVAQEALALACAAARIDESFERAVEVLDAAAGKIVLTGIGKSGLVARKISATLSATGMPSVFLHPAEALHGDLGVYEAGDPTILISKSGATDELLRLVPLLRRFHSPLIGILGHAHSPLGSQVDVVLEAHVDREADPHNMLPTTSAIVALALGDALAVALMKRRDFRPDDYGRLHPAGQLGRNLNLRVEDVMHRGEEVAWVAPEAALKDVVIAMTRQPLGAACVAGVDGTLAGLITDGDLRRALQRDGEVFRLTAADLMTARPVVIGPGEMLKAALERMENRASQLSVLPVVDPATGRALGLLRLHDIYRGR